MKKIRKVWVRTWLNLPGPKWLRKYYILLASLKSGPYYSEAYLASFSKKRAYISPKAQVSHKSVDLSGNVFIDDRVLIFQASEGGPVEIKEGTRIFRDSIIQTGMRGQVEIGKNCMIQPRVILSAYKGSIKIGPDVSIGANVAMYPYNHGFKAGTLPRDQPIESKGDIVIGSGVMIGYGVIILEGVTIGDGAIVGAGSVVMQNIPPNAIVFGNPARMFLKRGME